MPESAQPSEATTALWKIITAGASAIAIFLFQQGCSTLTHGSPELSKQSTRDQDYLDKTSRRLALIGEYESVIVQCAERYHNRIQHFSSPTSARASDPRQKLKILHDQAEVNMLAAQLDAARLVAFRTENNLPTHGSQMLRLLEKEREAWSSMEHTLRVGSNVKASDISRLIATATDVELQATSVEESVRLDLVNLGSDMQELHNLIDDMHRRISLLKRILVVAYSEIFVSLMIFGCAAYYLHNSARKLWKSRLITS